MIVNVLPKQLKETFSGHPLNNLLKSSQNLKIANKFICNVLNLSRTTASPLKNLIFQKNKRPC
jgi:hypothetical protein